MAPNSESDIDQKENLVKRRRTVIKSIVNGEISSDGQDSKINQLGDLNKIDTGLDIHSVTIAALGVYIEHWNMFADDTSRVKTQDMVQD